MTITASEMFRSRRGDAYAGRERDYLVTGTGGDADLDDTAAISAAASASPATILGTDGAVLVRTNATISREISNDKIVVSVQYGELGVPNGRLQKPIGDVEYEFSYQAPSERIYQSLETVGIYAAGGISWNTGTFGGAIGVQRTAEGYFDPPEGVETTPGNTTNTWLFTVASISLQFEVLVEGMMGAVNVNPWRGRPAGSMRFVQCNSNASSSGKATIRFGFQYSPNVTNLTVGNITIPEKQGHDYLWVYRELAELTLPNNEKLLLPSPKAAVVERVFRRANFALLGF